MNLSGRSVRAALDFFALPLSNLLVICDDLNLPLGSVRLRTSGSAGGQKGLQNICDVLGTQMFPRLRIGIGAAPPNWDAADYVLAKFSAEEKVDIERAIDTAVDAVSVWMESGIDVAMARFNGSGNKVDSNPTPNEPRPSNKIKRPGED
jgi:PTH1 family peptidyl-tRNA hydrolase